MSNEAPRRSKFNTVNVNEVHTNVSQEIIEITSDKLTIILTNHVACLERSREWHTPLGLFLTIALVLITADFKKAFGLTPDTWSAIFILGCGLCLIWLVKSLTNKAKAMTIEDLLKIIKNQVET